MMERRRNADGCVVYNWLTTKNQTVPREEHSAIKEAWMLSVNGRRSHGRQRLRMRDVVRRDTEVAVVVEGTATVKNERRGEERHGGGSGCGGDGNG